MKPEKPCCAVCGTPLPASTLGRVCPDCAFGGALGLKPEGVAQPSSAASSSGVSPPGSAPRETRGQLAGETPALQNGATARAFGDYELLEEIARGGMGVVYKARQLSLDRLVAVKMILAGGFATQEFVQRFRTEASAAAVLHHPNIVAIHEVGVHAGQHYFSMDYVDGPSLAALVGHVPLPARRAAQYVKTIAEAIHYAHEQGILHRDLKPSNVLIDANDQPRITDFGLAKRLAGETSLTLSGQMVGSPNFMPPEQATARHGKVGRYSDVYALGGILYHLLTVRPPFQADSLEIIVSQVLTAEPVSPRLLNPAVPRDLETICLKCLEKEPSRRYATAQAVADELGRFLRGEPILARPIGPTGKVWRWCRRKPALATALGAVVLVALVGFMGIVWQWRRAKASELFALQNAYAADMKEVQRALETSDVLLAESLLNRHRPGFGVPASAGAAHKTAAEYPDRVNAGLRTDLRGWEWRYLWQLCQPAESVRLQTNSGPIGKMAISQDGKVMAVQTGGDKVVLWDLTARRQMTELPVSASIQKLVLSPTGNRLAVSTRTARGETTVETVKVWDVPARRITSTLDQPEAIRSLAFSPDGSRLATFDIEGNISVVEWASHRSLTNFHVHPLRNEAAGVVIFSPDGNRLAIGEDSGRIGVWNWRTGTVVTMTSLAQAGGGVTALAFSPTTGLLAAGFGAASGTIGLWDASSGEPRGQLTNHTRTIKALAFTADGGLLASVAYDRTIRIWSVADRTECRRFRMHPGEGLALAFLPDGKTLVSSCRVGTACFWDVTPTHLNSGHPKLVISYGTDAKVEDDLQDFASGAPDAKEVSRFGFTFTPDGRSFITTDPDGSLGVWDTRSVQRTESLPALGSNHWGVALSPDGHWLAVGNASGKVHVWDWTERRAVTNFAFPFKWFGHLRFSRTGRFLWAVVEFNDRTTHFKIWRTNDWQEVPLTGVQAADIRWADFSPDDRLLAAGYANGAVKLWDFPSGRHETTFTNHKGSVISVLFSPDGRMLVSTGSGGSVVLRDLFAHREAELPRGHFLKVWGAGLSSDGRRLATGGGAAREAVILWDLATQRQLLTLQGEGARFAHVVFSPDGGTLMATSFAGIAHLWRAPTWKEIEAAEKAKVAPLVSTEENEGNEERPVK